MAINSIRFAAHYEAYPVMPIEICRHLGFIRELRRVLALRDTTGQIYEGLSGLPQEEGE